MLSNSVILQWCRPGVTGKVTKTELTQATAMLSKLNVIGVVANGSSGSSNGYSPYTREYEVVLPQSEAKIVVAHIELNV